MNTKKFGIISLVIVAMLAMVGVVGAQDDNTNTDRHRRHHPRRFVHRAVLESLVEDTGLEPREVRRRLSDHVTTFADLINENGGNVDASIADGVVAGTAVVEGWVADGKITRERADKFLEGFPDRVAEFVNTPRPERDNRPPRLRDGINDSSSDA